MQGHVWVMFMFMFSNLLATTSSGAWLGWVGSGQAAFFFWLLLSWDFVGIVEKRESGGVMNL